MSSKSLAFAVADDPAYLAWLQNALGERVSITIGQPDDADDLFRRLSQHGRYDLLFCEFEDYNAPERAALIESIGDRLPELPVVAIGSSESAATVLAAMRAGARDFFVLKRDDAKLAAQVGKLLRRVGAASVVAAAGLGQGKLFTVLGASQHDSVAFLASHLALAFAERNQSHERVLLIDAAMPAGAGAIFLNVSPTYSLLDAVGDVHRCDQTLVDTAFARHSSGIHLLSLPEEYLTRPALSPEDFGRLLQVLKSLFGTIVLSLDGQAGTPLVRAALAQSNRTLLLSDQSILKSRQGKYLLRALRLEDTPLEHTALVIDYYRRRLGLEPQNLAELFDLPLMATLTSEGVNRIQSMNSGESMFVLAPKDTYCEGVRNLAAALATGEAKVAATKEDGLLSRLFR
jgi:pilus assembly protein CpaE